MPKKRFKVGDRVVSIRPLFVREHLFVSEARPMFLHGDVVAHRSSSSMIFVVWDHWITTESAGFSTGALRHEVPEERTPSLLALRQHIPSQGHGYGDRQKVLDGAGVPRFSDTEVFTILSVLGEL